MSLFVFYIIFDYDYKQKANRRDNVIDLEVYNSTRELKKALSIMYVLNFSDESVTSNLYNIMR